MLPLPACLPFGPGPCLALPCGSCVAWGCGGESSPGLREPLQGPQPPPYSLPCCPGCCCPSFVGVVPWAAVPSLSPARQRALFETQGAARRRGRAPRVCCHTFGGCGGPPCLSARRGRAGTAPLPHVWYPQGELFGLGPRVKGCRQRGESACSPSSFFSWILEPFLFSLLGWGKERGRGQPRAHLGTSLPSAPLGATTPIRARCLLRSFRVCSFILQRRRVFCSCGARIVPATPQPASRAIPLPPAASPVPMGSAHPARGGTGTPQPVPPLAPNATQQPPWPPLAPLPARWVLYERIQTSLFLFINIVLLDSCFVVVFFSPGLLPVSSPQPAPSGTGLPGSPILWWPPHFCRVPLWGPLISVGPPLFCGVPHFVGLSRGALGRLWLPFWGQGEPWGGLSATGGGWDQQHGAFQPLWVGGSPSLTHGSEGGPNAPRGGARALPTLHPTARAAGLQLPAGTARSRPPPPPALPSAHARWRRGAGGACAAAALQ